MNFVQNSSLSVRISRTQLVLYLYSALLLSLFLAGCSDQVRLPTEEELVEFKNAGPLQLDVDVDASMQAQMGGFPHRVVPGEVLEFTMPAILKVVTANEPGDSERVAPYICRVNENGTINLPLIGDIEVAGKTLIEIESAVIDAYYPKYTVIRPSVFARIIERFEKLPFVVLGLVNRPGSHTYPENVQYNIMQAIGIAGGLNMALEPRYAMVYRLKADGEIINATFRIVNGEHFDDSFTTNIKPGDIIAVEHTPRTRTTEFLRRIFRINIGTYIRLEDIWED